MAQQDIIREFLVSLGFKVDKTGLRNFQEGVEDATKAVAGLVAGIEAAALAIGAAVQVFARNAEQLYFQARRVGDNAADLKAFGNAARNMGVDVTEALGSIEAVASQMRNNPGTEGLLQSLGIKTRDAKGQMRDSIDLMVELGQALQKYEPYLRKQYADQFGISEKTLLALADPGFAAELERQRTLLADSGFDKAVQDAHLFEIKLRNLVTLIEAKLLPVMDSMTNALGPQMDEASKWFNKNGAEIKATVEAISTAIVNIGAIMLPILGKIADGWKLIYDLVKDTGAAINKMLPEGWGDKIGWATNALFEQLGIADIVYDMATGSKTPGAKKSTVSGNDAGIVSKLMEYGWTKEQAIGIAANLKNESGYNPNAVGDNGQAYGIAQWHPDRQAAFRRYAGKDIRQSTLDEQLGFVNYELTIGAERQAGALLKASTNARQSADVVSRYYERPAAADFEAAKRGETAVHIAQNTTIHVNGAGDPAAVGNAVAGEQQNVNANMTRNLQTAVK